MVNTFYLYMKTFQRLFYCWHSTVMLNLQKKPCWQTGWVSEISCILFLVFPIVELEEARHQNHNGDPKFLLPAPLSSHVAPSFSLVLTWPFGARRCGQSLSSFFLETTLWCKKDWPIAFWIDWLFVLSSSYTCSLAHTFFWVWEKST